MPNGSVPAARAWCFLVWLSFLRLARARQMVWIALALLLGTVAVVLLNTAAERWGMNHWRSPYRRGPTFPDWLAAWTVTSQPLIADPQANALALAVQGASGAALANAGFYVFSRYMVFNVFLSFLLPIWSLSFATDALGGEREDRTLIWLLSRPLSRPGIYVAKFVALLPWSLGLNLGGFALICLAAGTPGYLALRLYWPAVLGATCAFAALFHLMGALWRRAAVMAIVYVFFLETVVGNMPGTMKRISITFYARCLMYDAAGSYQIQPEQPAIFMPVDPATAWAVLAGLTLLLLAAGMVVFSRKEYADET
ncbi:MAG: ABC transporter permease [Gemmataceae bacterium]